MWKLCSQATGASPEVQAPAAGHPVPSVPAQSLLSRSLLQLLSPSVHRIHIQLTAFGK